MNGTNHLQIVLNANSVNMFKNKEDISQAGGLRTDE